MNYFNWSDTRNGLISRLNLELGRGGNDCAFIKHDDPLIVQHQNLAADVHKFYAVVHDGTPICMIKIITGVLCALILAVYNHNIRPHVGFDDLLDAVFAKLVHPDENVVRPAGVALAPDPRPYFLTGVKFFDLGQG